MGLYSDVGIRNGVRRSLPREQKKSGDDLALDFFGEWTMSFSYDELCLFLMMFNRAGHYSSHVIHKNKRKNKTYRNQKNVIHDGIPLWDPFGILSRRILFPVRRWSDRHFMDFLHTLISRQNETCLDTEWFVSKWWRHPNFEKRMKSFRDPVFDVRINTYLIFSHQRILYQVVLRIL